MVHSRRIYLFVNGIKRIFFVDVHRTPRSPFFERLIIPNASVQRPARLKKLLWNSFGKNLSERCIAAPYDKDGRRDGRTW